MSSLIIGCPGRLSGGSHFDVGAGGAEGVTSRWRGINRGNRGVGAKKPPDPRLAAMAGLTQGLRSPEYLTGEDIKPE